MRNKWGYIGYTALGFGSTVAGLAAAAGCSVGQGSPEGWRYLDTGTVAVAHPKSWHETSGGAVLRGAGGRTVAALTVTPGAAPGVEAEVEAAAAAGGTTGGAGTAHGTAGAATAHGGDADGRKGAKGGEKAATAVRGTGPAAPGYIRREELRLDGHRAQVLSYAQPTPDGRPAGHVEVRTTDAAGHPVVIRAWAVDGTADDPSLLREIVNSIQFTAVRPR